MTTVLTFDDAWQSVPGDMREKARDELLVLSKHLYEVDEKWSQLGAEARMIWLDVHRPMLSAETLYRMISRVNNVVSFLDNWQEMVKGDQTDDDYDFIVRTGSVGEAALRALFAIVDYVRARVA